MLEGSAPFRGLPSYDVRVEISPPALAWPPGVDGAARADLAARADILLASSGLPDGIQRWAPSLHLPLAARLAAQARALGRTLVVGVQGAQGSGKTTAASALKTLLEGLFDVRCAAISIDDFYLRKEERARLASEVHPLFRTRGVPGTHDVTLALATFDRLAALPAGATMRLPAFDKAIDDRMPEDRWPVIRGPVDVVLFEGWCVGVSPMPEAELALPVNALEREEDPDGRWRTAIREALAGPYRALFARLDRLVVFQAPSFDVVLGWRREQERALRRVRGSDAGMDDEALVRFVAHYERVTRWAMVDLPRRADVLVRLDASRVPIAIEARGSFHAEEGERGR